MDERSEAIPEESGYEPRPWYQVWGARIGLVLFVTVLIFFYIALFGGNP